MDYSIDVLVLWSRRPSFFDWFWLYSVLSILSVFISFM